jgi:NAD(P)-dependent dehydrogenase (short-subunit alcohol dehydrogenase family)
MFREIAEHTQRREGRIDLFFNNAGIGIGGEIADYDRAAWDDVLDVNVRGVAYGIDAVFPIMRAQRSGHIVNTASMAGLLSMGGMGSYTASKHAVVGLSKALRIEGRRHGVRVSALCPGVIRTPILHGGEYGGHVGRRLTQTNMERLVNRLRPMDPDRFAQLVLEDVAKNEPFIIVPRFWKAAWLLDRLAPRLTARLWDRLYNVALKELDAQEQSAPKPVEPKATAPGLRAGR